MSAVGKLEVGRLAGGINGELIIESEGTFV
jgi:hypothetical protein